MEFCALQVVLLCGFTLIRPNIPPWYIGEQPLFPANDYALLI